MCDLAARMTEADMGSIEDLDAWVDKVMSQTSFANLVKFC